MQRERRALSVLPTVPALDADDDAMMDYKTSPLDALHGWLVLAPLVALCAPPGYSFFDGASDTTSIGIGVAALGVLPAALIAIFRGRGQRTLRLAPLALVLGIAALLLPKATDTFGAWRSLTGLAAALGFAVSGACLGPSGRRVVQRGLGLMALVLILAAPLGIAWTGALGNTGDLSEAALPCAILGVGAFLTAEGFIAFTGFAGILLYALYAGFVPVYAGLTSLAATILVAGLGPVVGRSGGESGRQGAAKRMRILLVALFLGLLPIGYRTAMAPGEAAPVDGATMDATGADQVAATEAAPTTTGGFEFRRLTWAAIPEFIRGQDGYAAGPGQFQAAFPYYRDAAEIELSSFARKEPTPIEVEHAHNDWLTAAAEYGPAGGGIFILFLLYLLGRACRATWGADSSRRDFGFAAIAILVNALFNSPLLYGPVAPAIAFTILGIVAAPAWRPDRTEEDTSDSEHKPVLRYGLPALSLIALAVVLPPALTLLEYGFALAEIPSARIVLDDGREQLDANKLAPILDGALRSAPDSPVALEKQSQLLSRTGAPLDVQGPVALRWQAVRPNSFSANMAVGIIHAKAGRFTDAQVAFERARAADSNNPQVLHNLLRVACDLRSASAAETALSNLKGAGHLTDENLRSIAIEQLLTGRLEVAAPLVLAMTADRAAPPTDGQLRPAGSTVEGEAPGVDAHDADSTYPAMLAAKAAGDTLLADAYNVAFQMTISLDDLEHGVPSQAAISAHQALQSARGRNLDIGPIRLRKAAAKAAAAVADGGLDARLVDEAADILAMEPIRPEDWSALSQIEKDVLRSAELLDAAATDATEPK